MTTRALKFRNFLKVGNILPRTFEKVEVSKKLDLRNFGQKVARVKGAKPKTFGQRFLRLKRSLRAGKTEDNKDIVRNIKDISQLFQPQNIIKIGDLADSELRVFVRALRDTGFDANFRLHRPELFNEEEGIPDDNGWMSAEHVRAVIPFISAHAMLNWQKRTNLNILNLRGSLSLRKPIWLFERLPDRKSIPVPLSNILNIKDNQAYNIIHRVIAPLGMIVDALGDLRTRDPRTREEMLEQRREAEEEEEIGEESMAERIQREIDEAMRLREEEGEEEEIFGEEERLIEEEEPRPRPPFEGAPIPEEESELERSQRLMEEQRQRTLEEEAEFERLLAQQEGFEF